VIMNDKVKIYLDACCYIDLVQQRSGYPLASNEFNDHAWYCRRFLDAAIGNDIEVYGSTLLVTECTAIHKMNGGTKDRILTDQVKSSFRSILLAGKPVILGSADKFKSYLPDKYKQDQLALKQKQK